LKTFPAAKAAVSIPLPLRGRLFALKGRRNIDSGFNRWKFFSPAIYRRADGGITSSP